MTAFRVQAKRTTNSGPPPDLEFGELAYSDADQQFYIGRADSEQPPTTFDGSPTDYGPAIATISTDLATLDTSQAAQADAIAAIALEQGVQNDAIAALQAQPVTHGFSFDQQAEPLAPAAGATWRERSAGGLIIGDWEWIGSVWASLNRTTLSGLVANSAATTYPAVNFEAPRALFVQCRVAINPANNPVNPFNETNYRELYLSRNPGLVNSVFSFRPMISLAQSSYVSAMAYLNPSPASFLTNTTVVGTPGTMHAPSVSWVYREVRA